MKIRYPQWLIERTESWVDRYFGWRVIKAMLINLVFFFLTQVTLLIGVIASLIQPISDQGWNVLWSEDFKVWERFRETGFGAVLCCLSTVSGSILGVFGLVAWIALDILEEDDDDPEEDDEIGDGC